MRLYVLGMLCIVTLANNSFAMTLQQRSRIEMERVKVRQLTDECKLTETSESLDKIAKFQVGIDKDQELVSLMQDAIDNIRKTFRAIDEKCAAWKGNRSALLPLSSQKAFILRNFSDFYAVLREHFRKIHTKEAEHVRNELRLLGFVDI